MTSPTQRRHDELVALLTDIRDALRPRTTGIVHAATVNGREFSAALKRASTTEPVDVTEEPPVGYQVTDSGRDVWQRFEAGWTCWNRQDSQWGLGMCVDFRWSNLRNFAPLRLTTDADRERVGLLVDTAPDVDPDATRPASCCGNCPPITGGGYDCTCDGNPRCGSDEDQVALASEREGWRTPPRLTRERDEARRGPRQEPNRWCPKMLRERLCQQETHAPEGPARDAIGDLIALLDLHRPLGPDGSHGDRHTPTCGCDDEGA